MNLEMKNKCVKYGRHIENLCGVSCFVLNAAEKLLVPLDEAQGHYCTTCANTKCHKINTHLYGSSEAYRWNGKYIYYCSLGLVFVASSLSDDRGQFSGALVAGPVIMGDADDNMVDTKEECVQKQVQTLPNFSTARVNDLCEILEVVAASIGQMPRGKMGTFVYEQEKALNSIYQVKDMMGTQGDKCAYPISVEKQLQNLVLHHDKKGSLVLLNELLGHIYVANDFDAEAIKPRIIELVVILSRTTIDAGADANDIFLYNGNYIKKIEEMDDLEELSVWITALMHRFINYSFDFREVKHSDVVYKVMEYVKENYNKKVSLDDIACHVYLSKAYLSSIFKEEAGKSLSTYINQVKIEKSKQLLMDRSNSLVDIANFCGFEDQSYFTKVFKKYVGVAPKAYRASRG